MFDITSVNAEYNTVEAHAHLAQNWSFGNFFNSKDEDEKPCFEKISFRIFHGGQKKQKVHIFNKT